MGEASGRLFELRMGRGPQKHRAFDFKSVFGGIKHGGGRKGGSFTFCRRSIDNETDTRKPRRTCPDGA